MTRRRGKLIGLLAVVLAFSLTAASCGGDDKASTGDNSKKAGTEDSAKPQPGGSMTIALDAENSGGWCLPAAQLAAAGIQVANAIYDPLVILDSNYQWKPYLAETVTPNADFTEWTFKMRSGIKFSDGSPLDADIVKENLDLTYGEPTAVARTGIKPLLFAFVYSNFASVDKVDDLTVSVKLKTPWANLPFQLANSRNGIIGRAQIDAGPELCKEKLVGTGPFQIVSWTRNQQLETKKNSNYWRKDAAGVQLPYLDNLTFKPIEGGDNRLSALEGGTVDAIQTSTTTSFDVINKSPDKYNLILEPDGRHEVTYGQMNLSKAPFNDVAVRTAFAQAIDRDAVIDIMTNGQSTIANQPFDTKVLGYVDGLELPKYDPDAAAKVLKGKNLSFTLSYATDAETKLAMEDIKRQLADVGVTVTIKELDTSSLINSMLSGDFEALFTRNHFGNDPDTQYIWWHSGMPTNFGRINDPDLDKLLDQGRAEGDQAKRKTIYQDIAKLFADKVYNIWAYYARWGYGTNKKVHNLGYNTLPDGSKGTGLNWGFTYLPEVWIDH